MGAKELNEYIDNIVATMPESFQKAVNANPYAEQEKRDQEEGVSRDSSQMEDCDDYYYYDDEERAKFNIADCELVSFSVGGKTWEVKK